MAYVCLCIDSASLQLGMLVSESTYPHISSYITGWWFGTCFPYIGNNTPNISQLTLIFFRGVAQPPTRHMFRKNLNFKMIPTPPRSLARGLASPKVYGSKVSSGKMSPDNSGQEGSQVGSPASLPEDG